MGEAIYRIDALRGKVMELLQARTKPMTAGAIAVALDLPFWAVQAGLEAAQAADLVEFGLYGYRVANVALAPVVAL